VPPAAGAPAAKAAGTPPLPPAPNPATSAASRPAPPPARPRPRTVAPARNATDEITIPPSGPPPPRARRADPQEPPDGGKRSLLLLIVGGLAIIVIAFVLITQVFGGSDSSTTSTPATNSVGPVPTSATTTDSAAPAVDPAATQVAVFNGTTGSGIARAAADKLLAAGFTKVGPVTTAPDQTAQTSTVYYDTGAKAAADQVATTLGLSSAAVMAIDENIRVLGQNAVVVVVLGADQAQ